MDRDQKVFSFIKEELKSENSKEKYLDILSQRMEDNRKAIGRLFLVLILSETDIGLASASRTKSSIVRKSNDWRERDRRGRSLQQPSNPGEIFVPQKWDIYLATFTRFSC